MTSAQKKAALRAELDARAVYAKAVFDAMMTGDMAATAEAQRRFREAFPSNQSAVYPAWRG